MKSATVTWITYNNYGTELQAFALQQYILKLGVDNTIISDEMILRETRPNLFGSANVFDAQSSLSEGNVPQSRLVKFMKNYLLNPTTWISLCRSLFKLVRRATKRITGSQRGYIESQEKLDAFKNEKLRILYGTTRQGAVSLNDKFDVFVCGSDQIWSPLKQNFDGYYYLNFANKKKISYAASLGTTNIEERQKEAIANWTKDFERISVREKQSAEQLLGFLGRNVEWVLDPTLLFDKTFWNEQRKDYPVKNNYIVCYFLENKEWYLSYAKALCKYLNVDLYIIPSSEAYSRSKYGLKKGVGPQEFVDLIAKADFVLTDSYHASIFSLLFEKKFLCFKRFKDNDWDCQNIRIESLFGLLEIENLIIDERDFAESDIVNLDYKQIKEILEEKRECSQKFLKGCLL